MATMLRSKLLRPLSTTPLRAFASSALCRDTVPSLGDIKPDGVTAFDTKQKQFRDDLAAAKRKKEQAESQLRSSSLHSEAPSSTRQVNSSAASIADADVAREQPLGLGSLNINTGEQRQAETESSTKRGGKLSNFIYGTVEGQQHDAEIERSFSQLLARGKYVHSIVIHDVYPDKVDEYTKLIGSWFPKVATNPENKVNLVGSWRTEVGDCDTFVHIWEYQRYLGYHQSLYNIHHHGEFPDFEKHLSTLIKSKHVSLMQEFSFWPTTPPRELGGLFELRSYTLHPGNLLEWETHWRKGLKARREVMEGVGAWFVQIGDLNTVHHLWQFANLEERRLRREQSWGVDGWADTVHKTVPLIQTMQSRILVAMPWSPVR